MSSSRPTVLAFLAVTLSLTTAGCWWGSTECLRAVDCVERCGGPVIQSGCSACPSGSFDDLTCRDASTRDAATPTTDVGMSSTDAFSVDASASTTDAGRLADGGGTSLPFHLVRHDCGPTDGPALHIGLYGSVDPACGGDSTQRSLEIFVYPTGTGSWPPAAGTTITSTDAAPSGVITECPGGAAPCRTSFELSVTFDAFTDDVSASGDYTVTFDDGETTTGTFDATWCEREPILCG